MPLSVLEIYDKQALSSRLYIVTSEGAVKARFVFFKRTVGLLSRRGVESWTLLCILDLLRTSFPQIKYILRIFH